MQRLENIIKIVSLEEFETLALRVGSKDGSDALARSELVQAILDINSLIEGAELLNLKYKKKQKNKEK